jgi:catechol 2,3-dioxygenase-like lactoylglutathione lyase family enzyme
MADSNQRKSAKRFSADEKTAVVRYQVRDIDRSVAFYREHLGFESFDRPGPPLAIVSRGDLQLLLSGADASGGRPMPSGQRQEPGGWNRIVLYVKDLDASIEALKDAKVHLRNQIEEGPGGRQILIDDPDGNPIELHEAPRR